MTPNDSKPPVRPRRRKSISMHADVPVWHDSCSCEAEPYWVEAMAESDESAPREDVATRRKTP